MSKTLRNKKADRDRDVALDELRRIWRRYRQFGMILSHMPINQNDVETAFAETVLRDLWCGVDGFMLHAGGKEA